MTEKLQALIKKLEAAEEGSRELDGLVVEAIDYKSPHGFTGDPDWHPSDDWPHYTTDLQIALALVPEDWWWHLSHLGVEVIPTSTLEEAPVSNARLYEPDGKPARFSSHSHYDRKSLPVALTCALLKARRALAFPDPLPRAVQAKAIRILRKSNPTAQWKYLEYQHKAHWIAEALASESDEDWRDSIRMPSGV